MKNKKFKELSSLKYGFGGLDDFWRSETFDLDTIMCDYCDFGGKNFQTSKIVPIPQNHILNCFNVKITCILSIWAIRGPFGGGAFRTFRPKSQGGQIDPPNWANFWNTKSFISNPISKKLLTDWLVFLGSKYGI